MQDTLQQITDRLGEAQNPEPRLPEGYTSAGQATVFVALKDSTPSSRVSDTWYQVRKKMRDIQVTLPPGVIGPDFNDEFGDTFAVVYGFTGHGFSKRELRDYVDDIRQQLLNVPDISKIDVLGAQDERVYVEFSTEQLAGLEH